MGSCRRNRAREHMLARGSLATFMRGCDGVHRTEETIVSNTKPAATPQPSKADQDHRSRQLNPQDPKYWDSRGLPAPKVNDAPAPAPQPPAKKP